MIIRSSLMQQSGIWRGLGPQQTKGGSEIALSAQSRVALTNKNAPFLNHKRRCNNY